VKRLYDIVVKLLKQFPINSRWPDNRSGDCVWV